MTSSRHAADPGRAAGPAAAATIDRSAGRLPALPRTLTWEQPPRGSAAPPAGTDRSGRVGVPPPDLTNECLSLRALSQDDAPTLYQLLRTPAVCEYVAAPPATLEAFCRFIEWTNREWHTGSSLTYGIVPAGEPHAVGIIQVWPIEPDYSTAEWGFALGEPYWGTGVFDAGARMLLRYLFGAMRVKRLEARSAERNERANRALERFGAVPEGVLRAGFRHHTGWMNQIMWSLLDNDWAATAGTGT